MQKATRIVSIRETVCCMKNLPVQLLMVFKSFKALFLLLNAFAVYPKFAKSLPRAARSLLDQWYVGFEREFYANLASTLNSFFRGLPDWLTHGAFLAGCLCVVQIVGLWRRQVALLWLVYVDSLFFLCLGLFGLTRRFEMGPALIVLVNAAVVWYMTKYRAQMLAGGGGSSGGSPKKPRKAE